MIFSRNNLSRVTVFVCAFVVCAFVSRVATAATLSLSPEQGTYVVGALIPLDIIVTSDGVAVNAVSGEISFPPEVVIPQSIETGDSVVDLWIEKPSVAIGGDSISFEGLVLNPGFIGTGKIATIYFRVAGEGAADIQFASGLILANDGSGTNILDEFSGAQLALRSGQSGDGTALPDRAVATAFEVEDAAERIRPPVVTQYSRTVARVEDLFLQGVTYPGADVQIYIRKNGDEPDRHDVKSDAAGNFVFVHGRDGGVGRMLPESTLGTALLPFIPERYEFWASVVSNGSASDATQVFEVVVGGLQGLGSSPVTFTIGSILVLIGLAVLIAVVSIVGRNRRILKALTVRLPQEPQSNPPQE